MERGGCSKGAAADDKNRRFRHDFVLSDLRGKFHEIMFGRRGWGQSGQSSGRFILLDRRTSLFHPADNGISRMTCHFGADSGWPAHREGHLHVRIPYLAAGGPDTAHSAESYMLSRESGENRMSILLPGLGQYLTPQADDVGSPLTIEALDSLIKHVLQSNYYYALAFIQSDCLLQT